MERPLQTSELCGNASVLERGCLFGGGVKTCGDCRWNTGTCRQTPSNSTSSSFQLDTHTHTHFSADGWTPGGTHWFPARHPDSYVLIGKNLGLEPRGADADASTSRPFRWTPTIQRRVILRKSFSTRGHQSTADRAARHTDARPATGRTSAEITLAAM